MTKTRDNHFVPQWHQKGFMEERDDQLCHLMCRDIFLKNGETKTVYSKKWQTSAQRFYKKDLYSTFFGEEVNDDIERKLFGPIDDNGSSAVRAFLTDDLSQWHHNFQNLFIYLDAQKLRTPKGLSWIQSKYPELSQLQLMMEMQYLRSMHCTFWAEGVRELVSAENSDVKFIVSDHPVTIYNHACPPESELCVYPSDPDIAFKGSQTIFPLDKNRCLILTNLEYARDPDNANPLEQRTNATRSRQSMVNSIKFINTRKLTSDEVTKINHVIKTRSHSSVAAGREDWLYPEKHVTCDWADIRPVLLPASEELHSFGGEMYTKFEDGSVHYQDAFGRTAPPADYLNKNIDESKIGRNSPCGCGSGRKYKNCCRNVPFDQRIAWNVASIRERNLAFCACIRDVLGLDSGKTWLDVRRELSNEQVSRIYGFYSALWPRDTEIYSLLPKPDGKFRGLYAGPIDVRLISEHALPLASTFDEFLIETPIINPNHIKPEFSPIESPSKYKYQALKDFLFMLEIEPFIRLNLVNLIPDPLEFDLDLKREVIGAAKERSRHAEIKLCEQEHQRFMTLSIEDSLNSIAMRPRDAKIQFLIEELGLTEEIATNSITELERHAEASPLMMLQPMNKGKGGQLIQSKMAPNYEMALFIAQVTGSVIVTDSDIRWRELASAQHREQAIVTYPWGKATDQLKSIPIDYKFLETLQKSPSIFASTRNLVKAADHMIWSNDRDTTKLDKLAGQALELTNQLQQADGQLVTRSFKALSPDGGLYDTSVQRLLVRSSCLAYDNQVRSVYGIDIPNK
ncbi:DUF4238 domain-containing protein [Vibrio sp. Vb339]|uniref:DUF4238 domain-containing protein n=1 Tax=Vibrio sp. Vb339 TaxID=1192013 RepID=UPI001C130F96|nr:DUF4238 domain-containing protein [Vibrio sp. Vb339]